jgi:hypothetical protein
MLSDKTISFPKLIELIVNRPIEEKNAHRALWLDMAGDQSLRPLGYEDGQIPSSR